MAGCWADISFAGALVRVAVGSGDADISAGATTWAACATQATRYAATDLLGFLIGDVR
jgi:hypothetical protein